MSELPLKDNTSLGAQTIVTVSPGLTKTSVADIICENLFLAAVLRPRESIAHEHACPKCKNNKQTMEKMVFWNQWASSQNEKDFCGEKITNE